jgi:hypothetical protein
MAKSPIQKGSIPADVKDMAGKATDLAEVARTADAKRVEDEQRQQAMLRVVAKRWDDAMNRLFKGIQSRPSRHAMMRRADERGEV